MIFKKKVFGLLFIPAVLFCLNYSLENIQSYNLGKPAVGIDTLFNLYLVGNTTGNDSIKYLKKQSGPWQVYTLAFSCVPSTNYNCRPSAAMGPDGSLHILYRVTGGTYGWPVYTNNISGSFTSCDTLTKIGSQSTYNYGIAVDNLNRAHIVCGMYTGAYNVTYYYPDTDSQLVIASDAVKPSVAVDRNNAVHIAYAWPSANPKIYYTNNSGGSFSAPVLVSDSAGTEPSICVDSSGFAHIAFANGCWNTASELFYVTNRTGSFVTKKVFASPGIGEDYAQIAISRQNCVAIIFWSYRAAPALSYIGCAFKRAQDPDFTVDSVGPAHTNTSFGAITWNDRGLVVDKSGYLHFAYYSPAGAVYATTQTPIDAEEASNPFPVKPLFVFRILRNPVRPPVTIAYERTLSAAVRIAVYDIDGRLVRDLGQVRGERVIWDGRDQAGNSTTSGVYILKAAVRDAAGKMSAETATAKIVIVK
jgi:hypothetical protein